jgi:hypothetical protein
MDEQMQPWECDQHPGTWYAHDCPLCDANLKLLESLLDESTPVHRQAGDALDRTTRRLGDAAGHVTAIGVKIQHDVLALLAENQRLQKTNGVYDEIHAERLRAHAKHGDTSMEGLDVADPVRLGVLTEEVGEVARALNEARHRGELDGQQLRRELIQVAAMATAWADVLSGQPEQEGTL